MEANAGRHGHRNQGGPLEGHLQPDYAIAALAPYLQGVLQAAGETFRVGVECVGLRQDAAEGVFGGGQSFGGVGHRNTREGGVREGVNMVG